MSALAAARALIAAGVPVVACAPQPGWKPGDKRLDVMPPTGWAVMTAADSDLSGFRPGVDTLAMVTGHGVDVVDCDPKNGGRHDNMPPFRRFGRNGTPSGGTHDLVRSTGVGKISPLTTSAGHVGDYCGGTPQGGSRALAFLPGSARPKYPGGAYAVIEPLDLAALLESDPDDDLVNVLTAHGGRREAMPGRPAANLSQVRGFLAEHSTASGRECHYGRAAMAGMLAGARATIPGDPKAGRHGWACKSAARCVELVRAGCAWSGDLDTLEAELDRIKPEGGSDWHGILAWALSNSNGAVTCGVHSPTPSGLRVHGDADVLADKRDEKEDTTQAKEGSGGLSDARLADNVADNVLSGRYCWTEGLGWLKWDGKRWAHAPEAAPIDAVRRHFIKWHGKAALRGADTALLKALSGLLSRTKIANVLALTKGIVLKDAADFDRHPDLLNVGNGVVDLTTGTLGLHDPNLLMTKLTPVHYRANARHPDWVAALTALPAEVADWMQTRAGQASTGHMTPDDTLVIGQGGGANGKTSIFGGIYRALGDHAVYVPERVLLANPNDHPTELMTLFGARLALIEETPEARHLSVKRLKDAVGTPTMTARLIRGNNVAWDCTHSLMLTTNYAPRVDETDHGTWRRLALVRFPYTFVDPGKGVLSGHERHGDPLLRDRLKEGRQGQHEAILAWVIEGARRWYALDRVMPPMPARVREDTAEWRSEADFIFGFIRDRLVFDADRLVATVDMLADFNDWSDSLGGKPWGDQTFTVRFGGHSECEAHNVAKVVTKKTSGISHRVGRSQAAPAGQIRAWSGVRFRTPADDEGGLPWAGSEHKLTGLTGSTGTTHEERKLFGTEPPCQPCQPPLPEHPETGELGELDDPDDPDFDPGLDCGEPLTADLTAAPEDPPGSCPACRWPLDSIAHEDHCDHRRLA